MGGCRSKPVDSVKDFERPNRRSAVEPPRLARVLRKGEVSRLQRLSAHTLFLPCPPYPPKPLRVPRGGNPQAGPYPGRDHRQAGGQGDPRPGGEPAPAGQEQPRRAIRRPSEELLAAVQKLSVTEAARMAMAFTVYFELVNLAEETHRVRLLRQRRRAQYAVPGTPPMRESIGAALRELKARERPGRDGADAPGQALHRAGLHRAPDRGQAPHHAQ